jgi:RimJ/RimL family protein N-acetyltransferase
VIETERLLIRRFTPEDAEELFALWGDPANERFRDIPTPASVDDVREWLGRWDAWGVWERATGELVGDCGLHFDKSFEEWELAYGFRRDRWGRGYATEGARACVRYGFDEMSVEKIVADVDPSNAASKHVLEKLGFTYVRDVEGKLFYELTR